MTTRGVLGAGALLLLANGIILVNVARNRAGNPDAVVRLSEREARTYITQENGTQPLLELRLAWKTAAGPDGQGTWFDRARLEALGVPDLPPAGDSIGTSRWRPVDRKGYAVLELAGPAWERWEAAEQAARDSARARRDTTRMAQAPAPKEEHVHGAAPGRRTDWSSTRLMAVDIGRNPLLLRQQYPDRSRYLILPATYRAVVTGPVADSTGAVVTPPRLEGQIIDLLPGTLHVPRPLRDSLVGLGAAAPDSTTHYEFTMKVGKRWEAWVE
jgi:hypothetical protein